MCGCRHHFSVVSAMPVGCSGFSDLVNHVTGEDCFFVFLGFGKSKSQSERYASS